MKNKKTFGQWVTSYTGQKYLTTFLFLLIPLVLLVVFTFIPAINMVIFSFQSRDQFGITVEWVGLQNYKTVFDTSADYLITFKNSIYYMIGSAFQLGFALLLATILCSKIKFKGLFKGVLFFPYLMNGVAVSLIFRRFFQMGDGIVTQNGTLNTIITSLGGEAIPFLSNPNIANFCLVFASMWKYMGFDILMFIGAIQSISQDVYEASDLDGVNPWQRFKYIVFPSIKSIISLQLILSIKGAVSVFDIPYIITGGKFGTNTFVIKTIETGFVFKKFGLASAMAVVLLMIIIVVTIIQKVLFKEDSDYVPKRRRYFRDKEVAK
ncbi:MAG: sugar ABC transporter permease [Clostridiales bacterium]|nr:sugar ABC transporter permease [Clostridiales bacterium]